jgi:hypothetical protein
MGRGGVVIYPHALSVIAAPIVSTCPCCPGDAVRRCPQPDTLTTTTCGKITCIPGVEGGIVDNDGITEVGAMPRAEGLTHMHEGSPTIEGIGNARVASRSGPGVVVIGNDGGTVSPGHILRLGDMRVGAIRQDDIYIRATQEGAG